MKKLQKVMYVATGALIGLSVAFTTTAIASTGTKTLQAAFRDIKLVIDGKTVIPKDGNGNVVEPFVVDGTTYLPVRAVGEALGKEVNWDGNTNTVTIGAPSNTQSTIPPTTPIATAESIKLSSLDYFTSENDFEHKDQERANNGDYFNDCFLRDVAYGGATRDYLVNSQYKKISGTIFLEYESRSGSAIGKLNIWGDGKLLYSSDEVKAGFMPTKFDVDISNVSNLKIGFEGILTTIGCNMGVSDVTLYK